jgi:hypothetical protein
MVQIEREDDPMPDKTYWWQARITPMEPCAPGPLHGGKAFMVREEQLGEVLTLVSEAVELWLTEGRWR